MPRVYPRTTTGHIEPGLHIYDWEVLAETRVKGRLSFSCKCKCGTLKVIAASHLASGASKRCRRCSQRKQASPLYQGYEEIYPRSWKKLQADAVDRNLNFTVTIEEAWRLFLAQGRRCALTGVSIEHPKAHSERHLATASFDRIDSSKGYASGNVQWVHKDVNRMKNNLNEVRFVEICRQVVAHAAQRDLRVAV